MKSFFLKKTVAAFLLLAMIFSMAFMSWQSAWPTLRADVKNFTQSAGRTGESVSTLVSQLNSSIGDKIYSKYAFVETYGYIQKLLDKKEINNFEVVKDNKGYLYYTYFTTGPNSVSTIAARMTRLKQAAAQKGDKVVYVMTPDKYIEGQTRFETGIPYNYANETADDFLKALKQNNVDTVDFRQIMKQGGKYTLGSFYKTDHHWKVQTAFWAYTQFVNVLQERYGLQFPHKAQYTNLQNFNQIVYKNSYIGSMARKEGILYSTTEDFTFIYPKFDTNFDFYAQSGSDQLNVQGRFENSIAFTSILSGGGDPYDADNDKFFTYMDGNPGFVDITNMNEPKGPKVLFIKDSLMVPVASFFALGCSKVYMVDPRYYAGSIEKLLADNHYDYVFVSFSPENLTEQFFPFYQRAGD